MCIPHNGKSKPFPSNIAKERIALSNITDEKSILSNIIDDDIALSNTMSMNAGIAGVFLLINEDINPI